MTDKHLKYFFKQPQKQMQLIKTQQVAITGVEDLNDCGVGHGVGQDHDVENEDAVGESLLQDKVPAKVRRQQSCKELLLNRNELCPVVTKQSARLTFQKLNFFFTIDCQSV